jgi:hypothetical protein
MLFSRLFKDVPRVMVPILWFAQSAELTPELANMAKLMVKLPAIGLGTFFGLAGIGALIIVCGIVITLRNGWEVQEGGDKLLEPESFSSVRGVDKDDNERKHPVDEDD